MTGNIWAITSYYNPSGYHRRLANYRVFRKNLSIPLIVAEMSTAGEFQVPADHDTLVVRAVGGDVMWQKEALLNIALEHVPSYVETVVWLDCDVIIEDPSWPQRTKSALLKQPFIQLFSDLHDLGPDEPIDHLPPKTGTGIARLVQSSTAPESAFKPSSTAHMRESAFGLAWAARRDIIQEARFYDAMILGSGDRALASALYGRMADTIASLRLSETRASHYLRWAVPLYNSVQGNVGFLDGRLKHLWHGDIKNRHYHRRHLMLSEFDFDPDKHLRRTTDGLLCWHDGSGGVRDLVSNYFDERMEDG